MLQAFICLLPPKLRYAFLVQLVRMVRIWGYQVPRVQVSVYPVSFVSTDRPVPPMQIALAGRIVPQDLVDRWYVLLDRIALVQICLPLQCVL